MVLLIEACKINREKALVPSVDVMMLNKGEKRWRERKTIEKGIRSASRGRTKQRARWQCATGRFSPRTPCSRKGGTATRKVSTDDPFRISSAQGAPATDC